MKDKGLFRKYEVTKLSNPDKRLDCIVLEFDDPISAPALLTWAYTMREHGYAEVFVDVCEKLKLYGHSTEVSGR